MTEGHPDRIISRNEIDELKAFLLSQGLDYPNYANWVAKTIDEIRESKRQAFGLFAPDSELCGDGVIRVTASGTVELRNFYIKEEFRKHGNGSRLLDYIEDYSIERGYTQIQIDVDTTSIDIARFLLGKGFQFQSRGDFYGKGKDSYLLIKKLKPKYIGDYDWVAISKWVMQNLWGYELKKELKTRTIYQFGKNYNDMDIIATLIINEDLGRTISEEDLRRFHESEEANGMLFCFAPGFSQQAKDYAQEKGINLIDRDKLGALSGFNLPRSYEDAAGLIVIIKPDYFEKLKAGTDRVFLKGGHPPLDVHRGQMILFYNTNPIMGIKGYAIIKDISIDAPSGIWAKHSRQSAFSEDEFKIYAKEKTEMSAYSFDEIIEIPGGVSLARIREILHPFNHQGGQRITINEWEKFKGFFTQTGVYKISTHLSSCTLLFCRV